MPEGCAISGEKKSPARRQGIERMCGARHARPIRHDLHLSPARPGANQPPLRRNMDEGHGIRHAEAVDLDYAGMVGFDTLSPFTCQSPQSAIVGHFKINDLTERHNGEMASNPTLLS